MTIVSQHENGSITLNTNSKKDGSITLSSKMSRSKMDNIPSTSYQNTRKENHINAQHSRNSFLVSLADSEIPSPNLSDISLTPSQQGHDRREPLQKSFADLSHYPQQGREPAKSFADLSHFPPHHPQLGAAQKLRRDMRLLAKQIAAREFELNDDAELRLEEKLRKAEKMREMKLEEDRRLREMRERILTSN
jgi:hypothetical protein